MEWCLIAVARKYTRMPKVTTRHCPKARCIGRSLFVRRTKTSMRCIHRYAYKYA